MNRSHHRRLASAFLNSLSAAAILTVAVASPVFAQDAAPASVSRPAGPAAVQLPTATAAPVQTGRERLEQMKTDTHVAVEAKAKSLDMGVRALPNATPPAGSELESFSALQREIRYLQLMQQRAAAIVGLYDTVNGTTATAADAATSSGTPGNRVLPTPVPPQPVSQSVRQTLNATPGYRGSSTGAFVSGSGTQTGGETTTKTVTAPAPDLPPVVSSITGTGDNVTATVLVPYTGEFSVKVGSVLPNGTKITSISASGVEAKDKKGKKTVFSFGDSVPMVRPTVTTTTTTKAEELKKDVIQPNNG